MVFIPPIKIVFDGPKDICQAYIKFARNQLSILEKQMSFQGLNEGRRVVSPYEGVVVECISSFSRHEVIIHADKPSMRQVPSEQYGKVEKRKEEEKDQPIVYFTRIKHPDYAGYEESNPQLNIDRIIIWDMDFDGAAADIADPTDSNSRGGGFNPGQGTILLDVDVLNEIIYWPENLGAEDTAKYLAMAAKYLEGCPSHIEPNTNLKDMAPLWFTDGALCDPVRQAKVCELVDNDSMPGSFIYDIDDVYTTPDGFFEFISILDQGVELDGLTNQYWKNDHCPNLGKDPMAIYNANVWPSLADNVDYYGKYIHRKIIISGEWLSTDLGYLADISSSCYGLLIDEEPAGMWYFSSVGEAPQYDGLELDGGKWYTPISDYALPSICISVATNYLGDTNGYSQLSISTIGYGGVPADMCSYIQFKAVNGVGSVVLHTPLEEISRTEFVFVHPGGYCSEAQCWFDKFTYFWFNYNGFEDTATYFDPYLPCPIEWNSATKAQKTSITLLADEQYSLHIPDPSVAYMEKQENFISMRYFYESRSVNYIRTERIEGIGVGSAWCNGVDLGPKSSSLSRLLAKAGYVGFVIYILAPRAWKTINQDNGEPEYWDMHSARRDAGIISPYRCLDLEEYLNAVVYSIEVELDARDDIEKLTDGLSVISDAAKPLRYYGYGITDGFLLKV